MAGERKEKAKRFVEKNSGSNRSQENPSVEDVVETRVLQSSLQISYDERMQIILLILISTCIFTLLFYGYLHTLPNSSLPIGLRKAIGMSSDATTLNFLLSRSLELLQQLSVTVSRALPLLPTVTSAPYIWSRKKRQQLQQRQLDHQ